MRTTAEPFHTNVRFCKIRRILYRQLSCFSSFVQKKQPELQYFRKKKNHMFRNILNLQKRNTMPEKRRQSDSIGKRTVKSIENLKISQMNAPNTKIEENIVVKKEQRRKGKRLTTLKLDSNAFTKSGVRQTMKLQITPFYQRITVSTTNSIDSQIANQIRQRIEKEIVPQVVQNSQFNYNTSASNFTYHREEFTKLLQKIYCLFLDTEEQQQDKNQINKSLIILKKLILEANKNSKIKRHQIVAGNSLTIHEGSFKDNAPRRRMSLEKLCPKKQMLSSESEALARKLQELKKQSKDIQEEIASKENRLADITRKANSILTYVQNQSRNKIIKVAGKHFRAIEADIHEYVVSLQKNKYVTNITYEPVAQNIQLTLKQLKKEFLQNSKISLEEKFNILQDFVLNLTEEHHTKEIQQQKIIQFKSKCIVTFMEKMNKWLENWNLKQDYLVNLRSQFSVDSETFESTFNDTFESRQDPASPKLFSIYLKLKENFLIGNSFY